jgi:hypothetical protein
MTIRLCIVQRGRVSRVHRKIPCSTRMLSQYIYRCIVDIECVTSRPHSKPTISPFTCALTTWVLKWLQGVYIYAYIYTRIRTPDLKCQSG